MLKNTSFQLFSTSLLKNVVFQRSAVVVLLIFSCFVLAAQDFEVAPVKLAFDCEPGEIQTKIMTIRNHGNQKQQFTLTAADMKFDTADAKTAGNKSCKDWMTINPSFIEINPNEKTEIKVIMQVPAGQSGTRGALIQVSSTQEQTALSADKLIVRSALKVRPRVTVKVTQSPKSNVNFKGSISNLKEITQPKDSVRTFQVKIANTGDKVIEAKVYLILSSLETAKEFKENPKRTSLFPGVSQVVLLTLPKNVPAGKYSMAAILDYGNNSALEAVQMNIEVK